MHYSPHIPIRLNVKKPKKGEAFILIRKRKFKEKIIFFFLKILNIKKSIYNFEKNKKNEI